MTGITACVPSNSIKVGDAVPNFSWTTITGEKIDLQNLRGSWVLLCYLQSYPDHNGDISAIRDIYDRLDEENLKVVIIPNYSYDIPFKDSADENIPPFYLVIDKQNTISKFKFEKYVENVRPVYFLIDTNGIVSKVNYDEIEYFLDPSSPPTHLPYNDYPIYLEGLNRQNIALDEHQRKILDVLVFLGDVIRVGFSDITVTNITSHGATITWKTDKAVPCVLMAGELCVAPANQNTRFHQIILDDLVPNKTYTFAVTAYGLDRHDLYVPSELLNTSNEFSFTTLPDFNMVNEINPSNGIETNDAILFEEGEYDKRNISSIGADGSGYLNLTEGSGMDNYNPSWSPDKKMIAYLSGNDENTYIKIMNRDGTNKRTLKLICTGHSFCFNCEYARPEWSPNGKLIAFTAVNSFNSDVIADQTMMKDYPLKNVAEDLYIINVYDGSSRKLSNIRNPPANVCNGVGYRHPVWSPDGSRIAFVSKYHSLPYSNEYDIIIVNLNDTNTVVIENGMSPCFMKDGRNLIYQEMNAGESTSTKIIRMNLDTGIKSIVVEGTNPLLSPNNLKLAYRNENNIYIADLTNKKQINLETDKYSTYYKAGTYAWSPDSKQLAIIMSKVNDLDFSDIYMIDAEIGKLRNITNKAANYQKITW